MNDEAGAGREGENWRGGEQEEQLSFYTSINLRVDGTALFTGWCWERSLAMFSQWDRATVAEPKPN